MYAWLLVAFLCGAVAGGLGAWYLLSRRARSAPSPAAATHTPSPLPSPPDREATLGGDDVVRSLSQTSQRMLTDLERRYEGRQEAEPEAPKKRRKSRPRR